MTLCKFFICVGILHKSSLYHVDGDVFQGHEIVEWSRGEDTCQRNGGKLFKPNETSFSVSLFSEFNVKDDLWVAAKYINILNFESAFRFPALDSAVRCEMCQIENSCRTKCLYMACWNGYGAVCESKYGPNIGVLYEEHKNWTEASLLCEEKSMNLANRIQNASYLFSKGYCRDGFYWTRNVIQVEFQSQIAPLNEQGECGILHNGVLSFKNCRGLLHPLCETVEKTTLETPHPHFSEGSISRILMNSTVAFVPTALASRRTDRINATIKKSSIYGTTSVANSISNNTSIGLNEENTSLLVPVGHSTTRNEDTGIIIGAVIGSVVFLLMTVLVILIFRRRLLQRTGERNAKNDNKDMKQHNINTALNPSYPHQYQDVPLQLRSGRTPFTLLESNCEGSHTGIAGQVSSPGKSASVLDPEDSNFNYVTIKKKTKANVSSSNPNSNIDYDNYDHLNSIQESRDGNVTGNVYDTANFHIRNGCMCRSDSIYNTPFKHGQTLGESVRVYDRMNAAVSVEYDTTYTLKVDGNATYDHI